jgi:hypothetical protein
MKKLSRVMLFLLVVLALAALASIAAAGGRPISTTHTGAAEVPGPGDPDGSGSVTLTLNPGTGEVCFEITVSNITLPATGAHIHEAPADDFGPVVVALTPPDASGTSSGCVSADREEIMEIIQEPEDYYVNVHTTDFPDGALRGQLSK